MRNILLILIASSALFVSACGATFTVDEAEVVRDTIYMITEENEDLLTGDLDPESLTEEEKEIRLRRNQEARAFADDLYADSSDSATSDEEDEN